MRRTWLATLLCLPTLLAAQAGTATWTLHVTLPDSLAPMTQGIHEIDLQMTVATDGQRMAMQINPGAQMAAQIPTVDLAAARVQMFLPAGSDTVQLGLVLPPEIAGAMGVSLGYRFDLPFDAIPDPTRLADSITSTVERDRDSTEFIDSGARETVAGIPCEVWKVTSTRDTLGVELTMCLAQPTPALESMTKAMERRFPSIASLREKFADSARAKFGGRDLMPIRIRVGGNQDVRVELQSISDQAPDAAFFTLPVGLDPFPIEMFKGMLPTPADATDSSET